jgi:hypothetical protein
MSGLRSIEGEKTMPCQHKPVLNFKILFARAPNYTCKFCGVAIEREQKFKNISKTLNFIFVAAIIIKAMDNSGGTQAGWNGLLLNVGIILGIGLIYILLHTLLIYYSTYQEIAAAEASQPDPAMDEPPAEKPQFTPEQLEIMAMYEALEKQARLDAGQDPEIRQTPVENPQPAAAACTHQPVASWKNYVPSHFDFVCANCGQPIVFAAGQKKSMNMIFLLITFLIIMPNIMDQSISFWQFGLYTLLALMVSTAIQIYFVKKGRFELKTPGAK